jgi:HK97 family phage major capsid protein/HK97 family phage prohead protease
MDKSKIPKNEKRVSEIHFERGDESNDELTFSFSSERPIERWWGNEVLSHEPGAANLDRLNDRGAFLFNHDRNTLLGSTLKAWIGADKRAYVTIRWADNPDAQRHRKDLQDGHLTHVSFAYDIQEWTQNKDSEDIFVTRWEAFEVSLVTIPADPTVGVGRQEESLLHRSEEGKIMPSQERRIREQERARVSAIKNLAREHKMEEEGEDAIENDLTIQQFRELVLERILSKKQEPIASASPYFGSRSTERYSLAKAIQATVSGDWSKAGFERECDEELRHKGFKSNGLLVPTGLLGGQERATYATGTPTQAGNLIGTEFRDDSFIGALRSRSVLMQMNPTFIEDCVGNIEIPRQSNVTSLGWVGENEDLPEADPRFDKIAMKPRTIGAFCTLSRMLSVQTTPQIEGLILLDFVAALAKELDVTVLHGSGVGNQPRGILNTPGVGSVVMGANGGTPTWDGIVELETLVSVADADTGSLGYVTNPNVRGKLKKTLKSSSANSDFCWQDSEIQNGTGLLNGYRALSSSAVRSNLTKGAGTNLSVLFYGNWKDIVLASWSTIALEIDPYHDFKKGTIGVRIMWFCDLALRHPQSFALSSDIVTT